MHPETHSFSPKFIFPEFQYFVIFTRRLNTLFCLRINEPPLNP